MRVLVALMLAWGVLVAPDRARAQEPARLALLIGNKGYTPKVGPLKNPHNDVDLVGAALARLGFKVTVLKDATYKQMDTALKRYVADVRRAGRGALSFFYYSGHGVSNPETQINYLIPVDVADADDDQVWFEAFQQNAVIDLLSKQASAATHYLVFDACRNELNVSGPNAKALGSDKGFVPVVDTSGLLIAYATAPKRTASDVGEGGGPYAKVLADELVKPGVEAVSMFRNVQIRVKQSIGQDPWLSFPSLPPVYLAGRSVEPAAAPALKPSQSAGAADVVRICREVEAMTSLSMLAVLERQHSGTPAADCISARIGELKAAQVAAAKAAEEQAKTEAATKRRAEDEARAKAEAERQRLAMLEQQRQDEARKAAEAEAARKRCDPAGAPAPGCVFRDCPTCPEMVVAPSGSFTMGSPANEPQRVDDETQVRVSISAPFAVGKYAITFDEWDACVADGGCNGYKPADQGWGRGKHPVINVNWDDAKAYASWLSRKTGKTYRLLSEAEREYVTRAGTSTPFWWGSSITPTQANYDGSSDPYKGGGSVGEYRKRTVPVDGFQPNPWGLYQVHGNVWEWTEDCWNESNTGNPGDGRARISGECRQRVLRGGSWFNNPQNLRSAIRSARYPDLRSDFRGFRLARTLSP